jgi:hypothetical protein
MPPATEPKQISRNYAWIDREYGREKWPTMVRIIQEVVAEEGNTPSLARVLARSRQAQIGSLEHPADQSDVVFDGTKVRIPLGAAFGAFDRWIEWTVSDYCRAHQAKLVLELGSGWGQNILGLAAGAGPADRSYVGAEYTRAGRDATDLLASLDPDSPVGSLQFDYHRPDLAALRGPGPVVVFTSHSVEQISQLSEAVLDEIISLAPDVTCVHFEPVGWQFGPSRGSSETYGRQHDYNLNLADLLDRYQRQNRLAIEKLAIDVIGINPANSTSVIVWRSTPQPR